jgi:hypothetical protein
MQREKKAGIGGKGAEKGLKNELKRDSKGAEKRPQRRRALRWRRASPLFADHLRNIRLPPPSAMPPAEYLKCISDIAPSHMPA